MRSEDIVNLFELIRNAPEENWNYNKGRLSEILHDFENDLQRGIILEGKYFTISIITDKVVSILQSMYKSYSRDEMIYSPVVWMKFKEKLNHKIQEL